jgi:hypothetical protein
MTRHGHLIRLLPLLLIAPALLPLFAQPAAAHTPGTGYLSPAVGRLLQPEPQPAPGPATPHDPQPLAPSPAPTPGPTPAPDPVAPGPTRSSPPEPTPGPTPEACEADGDASDCDNDGGVGFSGLLDVPAVIVNAVTSFLGTMIEQIMKPLRELLADTLLATPDVTQHADIKRLWTGMLGITAGVYVLFVTAGGITIMGYETVQTRYTLQQILPRLLLGITTATASLTLMGKAIGLSNALAHAIMATGLSDAGQGLVERIFPFALFGAPGVKLYLLLLAIVVIALVLAVLIGYLVRVAVMALLAVAAPLMLACHAHPLTDPIARLWWRGLAGCLTIQIAQSMTFILALKLFFAPGATTLGIPHSDQLGTMLAGLALFWVLFKIPGWTLQVVLRGTPAHQPLAPTGVRILKHLAMYRLMDHYLPGMHLLRRRPGPGGGGGAGGGPGRGGPTGGAGGRPRWGGGSGGGRPPASGPGARPGSGGRFWGRGRALLALSRATPPRPSPQPAPGAGTTSTAAGSPGPGSASTPRRQNTTSCAPVPGGPRTVIRPAQTPRIRPLALPNSAQHPLADPPTPLWPPIRTEGPAPPRATRPSATPTPAHPAPVPRTRQLALPIAVHRAPVHPPRPVQLRLPLEPPWR